MYAKFKNTLTGLVVAVAMLSVSYAIGTPPAAHDNRAVVLDANAVALQSTADLASRQRDRAIHRQMSMPFFSFARLMPKQGG
jgi:uncharacterized membrane protein YccC